MVPTLTSKRDAAKQDAVLLAAVDLARAALEEVAEPGTIGLRDEPAARTRCCPRA